MTRLQKLLGFVFVAVMAACSSPIPAHAASVKLEWTDNSLAPDAATITKVYEQSATGTITLGTLPGKWVLLASPAVTGDVDPSVGGVQNSFVVAAVTSGTHTYAVVASNTAGDSGPSNAAPVTVPGIPASHTGLITTVTVP